LRRAGENPKNMGLRCRFGPAFGAYGILIIVIDWASPLCYRHAVLSEFRAVLCRIRFFVIGLSLAPGAY